jgi:hypothetical protein
LEDFLLVSSVSEFLPLRMSSKSEPMSMPPPRFEAPSPGPSDVMALLKSPLSSFAAADMELRPLAIGGPERKVRPLIITTGWCRDGPTEPTQTVAVYWLVGVLRPRFWKENLERVNQ